jgi:hypothetical protein
MGLTIRDERQQRALTGLSSAKFAELSQVFGRVIAEAQAQAYTEGRAHGTRQRQPGGGQKGKLPTVPDKVLFILYYYKVYPTFDVLAAQFDMARSKACENVQKLTPLLQQSLARLGVLPRREFASVEALRAACADLETLLLDVTERPHQRPQAAEAQRALYSGKKSATP